MQKLSLFICLLFSMATVAAATYVEPTYIRTNAKKTVNGTAGRHLTNVGSNLRRQRDQTNTGTRTNADEQKHYRNLQGFPIPGFPGTGAFNLPFMPQMPAIPMMPLMPSYPSALGSFGSGSLPFADMQGSIAEMLAMPDGVSQLANVFQGVASAIAGGEMQSLPGLSGAAGGADPLSIFFPGGGLNLADAQGDPVKATTAARQIVQGLSEALRGAGFVQSGDAPDAKP